MGYDTLSESIDKVREELQYASCLGVLTGAGISAESGIPTFRGEDGLWRNHKPEQLATVEAFETDPELVWEFYNERRNMLANVEPNPAHYALVELEEAIDDFWLITQNVDGLHKLAGSENVLEIHGSLWNVRCTHCGQQYEDRSELPPLPRCQDCGGLLRPGVIWFGENLDERSILLSAHAAHESDLFLVVGTSGVVQPAASFAHEAKITGAKLVEINVEDTPITEIADIKVKGKAGEVLPQFL